MEKFVTVGKELGLAGGDLVKFVREETEKAETIERQKRKDERERERKG